MKKFIIILLILVTSIFSTSITTYASSRNVYKEGFYEISDFNPSKDGSYHVENISEYSACVFVFNENNIKTQVLYLEPKSPRHYLASLKSEYRIVIVGDGQVHIDAGIK
jgi:hypothetical protein